MLFNKYIISLIPLLFLLNPLATHKDLKEDLNFHAIGEPIVMESPTQITTSCDAFMSVNHTDIEDTKRGALEDISCRLRDSFPAEFQSQFKVIDFAAYPILCFNDQEQGLDYSWEQMKQNAQNASPYYLLMGREFCPQNENGEFQYKPRYRVAMKLPNTGVFDGLNEAFIDGLESQVLDTMSRTSIGGLESMNEANINGVQRLMELLTLIKGGMFGGTLTKELLNFAGFVGLAAKDDSSIERVSEIPHLSNNIYDYSGLRYGNQIPLRNNFVDFFPTWLPIEYRDISIILTTNENYSELGGHNFNEASNIFETSTSKFTFWLHYYKDSAPNSKGEMAFKMNSTLTEEDALILMEASQSTILARGEIENEKIKDNVSSTRSSSCEGCEEIDFSGFFSGSWTFGTKVLPCVGTGSNCKLDPSKINMSEYDAGSNLGMLDGILEITNLGKQISDGLYELSTSFTPDYSDDNLFTFPSITDLLFMFESAKKGITIYIYGEGGNLWNSYGKGAYEHAKAASAFHKSLRALWASLTKEKLKAVMKSIWDALKKWAGELVGFGEPKQVGYVRGKLVFEVLIEVASLGGSGAVKASAKTTKELMETFTEAINNPSLIKDEILKRYDALGDSFQGFKCRFILGECFAEETYVSTSTGLNHIKDLELGDLVWSNNWVNRRHSFMDESGNNHYFDPYTSAEQTAVDKSFIYQQKWKKVELELVKYDGSVSKIQLLRPHWWFEKNKINCVGDKTFISIPEMGCTGSATVTNLADFTFNKTFPEEKSDEDYNLQPITGIFVHNSNEVLELVFDNDDTIGVTQNHPIYSLDRNDWQLAGDLFIGEKVLCKEGTTRLVEKYQKSESLNVYNLEIREDHNFLVGQSGLVVHNSYSVSYVETYIQKIREGTLVTPTGGIPDFLARELAGLSEGQSSKFLNELAVGGKIDLKKLYHDVGEKVVDIWKMLDDASVNVAIKRNVDNLKHIADFENLKPGSLGNIKHQLLSLLPDRHEHFLAGLGNVANNNILAAGLTKNRLPEVSEISSATDKIRQHRIDAGIPESKNFGYMEGNLNGSNIQNIPDNIVSSGSPVPTNQQVFDAIVVGGWLRVTDSEYKILNQLARDLGATPGIPIANQVNTNITGSMKIISERPYCASCQGVIHQFNQLFPGVEITLIDGIRKLEN